MSIETEGLHIQVHPSPELTPPEPRLFTTVEVEDKLQKAYALGWNAALAAVAPPMKEYIALHHKVYNMQMSLIDILKGSRYDWW